MGKHLGPRVKLSYVLQPLSSGRQPWAPPEVPMGICPCILRFFFWTISTRQWDDSLNREKITRLEHWKAIARNEEKNPPPCTHVPTHSQGKGLALDQPLLNQQGNYSRECPKPSPNNWALNLTLATSLGLRGRGWEGRMDKLLSP